MNTITKSRTNSETITLGRLIIALDDNYIIINDKKYDIDENEYNFLKTMINNKLSSETDIIDIDIKNYENRIKDAI